MSKLYTGEQVKSAFKIGKKLKYFDEQESDEFANTAIKYFKPIELPSDEEIEKNAQWVIDNRYPKSEFNKVSDFEMYHHIIKLIKDQILNQNK